MVDVRTQIGAVTRTLREIEVDGHRAVAPSLAQTYPAPIDDVWDALTSPERIARWFLPVSGDLVVGGRYQLEGAAGGEVLACEPPESGRARYLLTWEIMGKTSWLEARLAADGLSTRVEVEHRARTEDMPEGFWSTYGPGATGVGWDGGLLGLAMHLGAIEGALTPDEAAEWAPTDEGRTFYRGAADAWADAHVAAGADPVAAASAADETYRFYTGVDEAP